MLEPLEDEVLLTVHYPSERLEQLALYLLGFPYELKIVEPEELRDALVKVAERATQLARPSTRFT